MFLLEQRRKMMANAVAAASASGGDPAKLISEMQYLSQLKFGPNHHMPSPSVLPHMFNRPGLDPRNFMLKQNPKGPD